MARLPQIRGVVLEEIALYLLGVNGYVPIDAPGMDPTLRQGAAGLEVCGRGCLHQIDAIADYRLSPPFSNPQRLMVEAKSLSNRVGIDVVRNAVGVLKDISEFWAGNGQARYHYQYAIFTDNEFSERAQQYAFAHDVYLFPLRNANFLRPVVDALRALTPAHFGADDPNNVQLDLGELRRSLRDRLQGPEIANPIGQVGLDQVIAAAKQIRRGVIAVAMKHLPLFLVPAPNVDLAALGQHVRSRITWDADSWYLDNEAGQHLFSFDLPTTLFNKYASGGVLTRQAAINLKEDALSKLQATIFINNQPRVVEFELDAAWVAQIRERIEARGAGRDAR
jgi:hypothetical protein